MPRSPKPSSLPRLRNAPFAALALSAAAATAALANPVSTAAEAETTPPTLEPVIVRATRTPAASRQVMRGDVARSVPGTAGDPIKALQSLPGVVSPDDASSEPAIRGSRPSDNAYYVDFLPVGYLFHVGGLTSVLHADLIEGFELYSAAFGPQYDNVLGGVLDVTLREPRNDRLGGKLNVSLLATDLLLEGPVSEHSAFYFAARRSYFDLLVSKAIEDKDTGVIVTLPSYHDYQGKWAWHPRADQSVTLHLTGASDRLRFDVPAGSTYAVQDPALAGASHNRSSYRTEAVVWDAEFDAGVTQKLAIGQTRTRLDSNVGTAVDVSSQVRSVFLREQVIVPVGDAHRLTVGANLQQARVDVDLDLNDPRCTEFDPNCDLTSAPRLQVQQRINARLNDLYLSDRWQLAPAWAATLGVHHSRDSYLNRPHTEPRLGLDWQASERTTLSAAWGRHHQQPAGEQILPQIGNPALWHVQATHAVLGLTRRLDAGWWWRAEVYRKRFSNFVVSDPNVNYLNGGSGQAHGLELMIKKEPGSHTGPLGPFSGWLSVSLSQARRHNDLTGQDFRFEFDQPLIATLVGQYRMSSELSLGAKWSVHSGSAYTPIVGTGLYPDGRVRPIYGSLNSLRLPTYHRLDLRLDRTLSPTFKVYGEVINAYAHRNVSDYSYNADYSQRKAVTQLPLLLSFGVEVGF